MTDLKPYRPRNPSPWPRRMAIALAVALLIACMYVLSAQAGGPPPRNTLKQWPPSKPNYSYVCKFRPEAVSAWKCADFKSRRPYRP